MTIRVNGLRISLDYTDSDLLKAAAKRLNIKRQSISGCKIIKRSVDARRNKVYFACTLEIDIDDKLLLPEELFTAPDISRAEAVKNANPLPGNMEMPYSPVIIGSGPAGIFCGLYLAQNGYKPVIIEQGQDMERRVQTVERFWTDGALQPYSNIQFGEGGAGTFSDGKLTTRIGDDRISYVLDTFVKHGADEEINYLKKPHVGTDAIRGIVKNVRQEILNLGGEFYFDARLTDINVNNNRVRSIIINKSIEIPCTLLVLAVGNSARETYRLLHARGIELTPKAFALGVRVEHPQSLIDHIQYGDYAGHPRLGAADYHLTYQDKETGRAVYTFCMCPGGYVIAAASEAGKLVTNGMSYFARDTGVANSALVVTVKPEDWNGQALGGIMLQEKLEKKAFTAGGSGFKAPAQRLIDFLAKKNSQDLQGCYASYKPGVTPANLWEVLPVEIGEALWRGIKHWDKKMPGFIDERAVLTGVETRTSTPVRVVRNDDMCSLNINNIYPCGEGAGYAGGIMSSAVDGIKAAEQIIKKYMKPDQKIKIDSDEVLNIRELQNSRGIN